MCPKRREKTKNESETVFPLSFLQEESFPEGRHRIKRGECYSSTTMPASALDKARLRILHEGNGKREEGVANNDRRTASQAKKFHLMWV